MGERSAGPVATQTTQPQQQWSRRAAVLRPWWPPSVSRCLNCVRQRCCAWTVSAVCVHGCLIEEAGTAGCGCATASQPAAAACPASPPSRPRPHLPHSPLQVPSDSTRALFSQDVEAIEATVRALEHRLRDIKAYVAREAAAIPQVCRAEVGEAGRESRRPYLGAWPS